MLPDLSAVRQWDRAYVFGVTGVVFAFIAFVYLLVGPILIVSEVDPETGRETERLISLIESEGGRGAVLAFVPVIISSGFLFAVPRNGRFQRHQKINLWIGLVLMYGFIVLVALSIGIVFVPAAIMMTSVAVISIIRGRQGAATGPAPDSQVRRKASSREKSRRQGRTRSRRAGRRR